MAFTYSWSTIADGAIDPDSPIDTALMTALRNNVVYAYEYTGGKSYTPAEPHTHDGVNSALIATVANGGITEPKLAASAVSQSKLKTADNTFSANTVVVMVALAGGRYCFMPSGILGAGAGPDSVNWLVGGAINDGDSPLSTGLYSNDTVPDVFWNLSYGTRSAEVTLMTYRINTNDSAAVYVRYISASPPYDLGNGQVPTFTFLAIDNTTKSIDIMWDAADPPWANNGPTNINPLGRILRLAQTTGKVRDVARSASRRTAHFAALKQAHEMLHSPDPTVQAKVRAILAEPVTQEEKQRDMPLIPHPFASGIAGKTVVLLDPCGPIVEELFLAKTYGGDDITDIVRGGYLDIDNTPCGAISPPGVMAVGCRWKLTP